MLYERIVDPRLLVRRLTVIADDVATANELAAGKRYEQLDLFSRIDSSAEEGTMAMSAFRTVMCGVSMTCRLHCWRSRGNSAAMPSSRRWTWRTAPPAMTAIGRSEAIVHERIERIALSGVKRSPYGIT